MNTFIDLAQLCVPIFFYPCHCHSIPSQQNKSLINLEGVLLSYFSPELMCVQFFCEYLCMGKDGKMHLFEEKNINNNNYYYYLKKKYNYNRVHTCWTLDIV